MANPQSAGILAYRHRDGIVEVFLVHPGGPYWKNKDAGAWSIPKGEFTDGESPLAAAQREFTEETGARIDGDFSRCRSDACEAANASTPGRSRQRSTPTSCKAISSRWNGRPGSGRTQEFPEVDRGAWFPVAQALLMINAGQRPFLADLQELLVAKRGPA